MSERKIIVPDGMLKVVIDRFDNHNAPPAWMGEMLRRCLEEALRWLSENPIVPTTAEARELRSACAGEAGSQEVQSLVASWQRRMFLAPEPEAAKGAKPGVTDINEDEIAKRLYANNSPLADEMWERCPPEAKQIWRGRAEWCQRWIEMSTAKPAPKALAEIEDLFWQTKARGTELDRQLARYDGAHDSDIIEAYRRGCNSKKG